MKAEAIGLEILIKLREVEIEALSQIFIEGKLSFRETAGGKAREIPLTLSYDEHQEEFIEYEKSEEGSIIISVNERYYEKLKKEGQETGRFHAGRGSLGIYSEKVKYKDPFKDLK